MYLIMGHLVCLFDISYIAKMFIQLRLTWKTSFGNTSSNVSIKHLLKEIYLF